MWTGSDASVIVLPVAKTSRKLRKRGRVRPPVGPFEKRAIPEGLPDGERPVGMVTDGRFIVILYAWRFKGVDWVHLAIRRVDEKPIERDHWPTLLAIKDEVLGPEAEAAELYPARSRHVDLGPTYHLWSPVGGRLAFGLGPVAPMEER